MLVGTFVGDTGAYLGGRAFGRRQLAPRISPNKTVEGLVDRDASAAIAGVWCAGPLPGLALGGATALLLGVGGRVAAPIGDLFESLDQARRGHEGHRDACSAPTAARWTALDAALFALVAGYYVWLALL